MSVAIAGGFGGLGRAIVEAVLARNNHELVVLTRKVIIPGTCRIDVEN